MVARRPLLDVDPEIIPNSIRRWWMSDRIGQQLGNYQLLHLIGRGNFTDVYLGEHLHLNTQAAIKVLHTRLTSEESEKLRTEARTMARLTHPHIIRVLEFGVEDSIPFLIMEYAPNGTLRQCNPKGSRVPLDIVVSYVKQVADASSIFIRKSSSIAMSSRRACCWDVTMRSCSLNLALPSLPRARALSRRSKLKRRPGP